MASPLELELDSSGYKSAIDTAYRRNMEVLCVYGERQRPLKLTKGDRASELKAAFAKGFKDVLEDTDLNIFFQVESKQWGGRFVDLEDDAELESNAVVKAVPVKVKV